MNAVLGQSTGREQVLSNIISMLEALKGDDESIKQLGKIHPANLAVELAKILNKHGFITADRVINCTMNLRSPHASVPSKLQEAYNDILKKSSLPGHVAESALAVESDSPAAEGKEEILKAEEKPQLDPETAMKMRVNHLALIAAGTITANQFTPEGVEESLLKVLTKVALKDGDRLLNEEEVREFIRDPRHWEDSSITCQLIDALQRRAR